MTALWAGLLAFGAVATALALVAAWVGMASCDEVLLSEGEEGCDGECR